MLKHSPGPWVRRQRDCGDVRDAEGRYVIGSSDHPASLDWEKQYFTSIESGASQTIINFKGDQALILNAPDLYHTLEDLLDAVEAASYAQTISGGASLKITELAKTLNDFQYACGNARDLLKKIQQEAQ